MKAACRQCDRILAGTGRGLLWNVGGYGNVFMNSQSEERKDYYLFYHIANELALKIAHIPHINLSSGGGGGGLRFIDKMV